MKKVILGMVLLSGSTLFAQETPVSVYDCNVYTSHPTQSDVINSAGNYTSGCVDFINANNTGGYLLNQSTVQSVTAATKIHSSSTDAVCHLGPFTSNSSMHWLIAPSSFDVAVMNYSDLLNVAKLKKLELGIAIPQTELTKINNFVHDQTGDKLNPFLDWEFDVDAVFAHSSGLTKSIDGFYYRNYTRNTGTNDWDEVNTNYPFRVRFAPPLLGEWTCIIKIKVNGVETYQSQAFKFNVIETGAHGYTKVHSNQKNVELDGQIIFPLGQTFIGPYNLTSGWSAVPGQTNKNAKVEAWLSYQQDIKDYHDLGGRFIRTIQWVQSCAIEFEKKGNYYDRLHYAWETDQYMKYCDDNNMLLDFNLLFQDPISMFGNPPAWDFSHYKETSAGSGVYEYDDNDPLPAYCYNDDPTTQRPSGKFDEMAHNMFLDEDDLKYHRQRMRYYIARYGYSTSIMQFEIMAETFGLDQFGNNGSFEHVYSNQGDIVRHALKNYVEQMSTYTKNVLNHTEHLIGHQAYDNTIWSGIDYGDLDDQSLSLITIDAFGFSTYNNSPRRLLIHDNTPGTSVESNENSYYRKIKYYQDTYHKPVFHFEQGSVANGSPNECSGFEPHKIDVSTIGFTGCAGFFPWEGMRHDTGSDDRIAWPATVAAEKWMNGVNVTNILSNSSGNWSQSRHDGSTSENYANHLVETQSLISEDRKLAAGFVRNRTHNSYTKAVITTGEASESCVNYPPEEIEYRSLTNVSYENGEVLFVYELLPSTDYIIRWYEYLTTDPSTPLGEDSYGTDMFGRLRLYYPDLTVESGSVHDRPVFWYTIEKNPVQIGLAQAPNSVRERQAELRVDPTIEITQNDEELSLYPNPFQKNITLVVDRDASVQVFSSANEKVFEGNVARGRNTIDLSTLSVGVYFLKLSASDKMYKLVKI